MAKWVRAQLHRGLRPHDLALAVAVGAACAFFPVLGLATPLCVVAAGLLRLNQPLVQAVNALTSPLYPALVLAFLRLGAGATRTPLPALDWRSFSGLVRSGSPRLLETIGQGVGQALLGWVILSAVWIPFAYFATRRLIELQPHWRPNAAPGTGAAPP